MYSLMAQNISFFKKISKTLTKKTKSHQHMSFGRKECVICRKKKSYTKKKAKNWRPVNTKNISKYRKRFGSYVKKGCICQKCRNEYKKPALSVEAEPSVQVASSASSVSTEEYSALKDRIGKLVGRNYILASLLTECFSNAMIGEAYRKDDPEMERSYILKFINDVKANNDETHIVNKLSHPGIIKVLAHGTIKLGNNTWGYSVYPKLTPVKHDFITKGELARFDPDVKKWSQQILNVLVYIHSKKYIHMDVKPDNLVYDMANSSVLLIDFGCAVKDTDTNGYSAGTPGFTAPELTAGLNYTNKVDIYSAGVTLLSLALNYQVLETDTSDTLLKLLNERTHHVGPKWQGFKKILTKMIDPDPLKRPLAKDLLKMLNKL